MKNDQNPDAIAAQNLNKEELSTLQEIESAKTLAELEAIYMMEYEDHGIIKGAYDKTEQSFYDAADAKKINNILTDIKAANTLQKLRDIYITEYGDNKLVKNAFNKKKRLFYDKKQKKDIKNIIKDINSASTLRKLQSIYIGGYDDAHLVYKTYHKKEQSFYELQKKKTITNGFKKLQHLEVKEDKDKSELIFSQSTTITITLKQLLTFITIASPTEIQQIQKAVDLQKTKNTNKLSNNKKSGHT